ncbi:hypothetical protein ACIBI9_39865 [Nonomuraea sp. NPDC050451]|uniref:hypothetical protein n=1 Tax=Nonomuraea sp. NPDC050451 TaxID=3364364 RepID=UPI00378FF73A
MAVATVFGGDVGQDLHHHVRLEGPAVRRLRRPTPVAIAVTRDDPAAASTLNRVVRPITQRRPAAS